ncbi:hypothetical protein KC8_16830 [Sphingomonas sp. KC8]|nr:hypothetical protein KC8_16830 [Sphingomonas sp. KC8]
MEAAIHVKPFGFDRVFRFASSEPAPANTIELTKQIAALQAENDRMVLEHIAALSLAREDGFAAGLDQARGERDTAMLAATDALHAAIDEIDARLAETADAMMKDAADVAFSAAEILAGHAIEQAPARSVDEALGRVLQQVGRGTQLRVKVHPSLATDMERLIAARVSKERRKLSITVVEDDVMTPGDALIHWDEGGLAVDAAGRRAAVMAELGPLLGDRREA